jgi:ubiquinone/menaquinone biosynthesis C-methylase UbiE
MTDGGQFLPKVREQYELLPYPPVNPQDERKRLQQTWTESLPLLNHYGFGGRQSFRGGFRALVAGGGTGDATIYLAEQLRHTDAEVVHLDLSKASIAIAQERAAIRGLKNIRWVQDSLLRLPELDLGRFDYINCSGVLHHLADPDAGLLALKSVLKEGGAMGIMVYGAVGRTGVYHVQQMLRLANGGLEAREQIAHAREMLKQLPPTNILKRCEDLFGHEWANSDSGLFDLLLHTQDRAYTVEQLWTWLVDQRGFHMELTDVHRGRFPYMPEMTLAPDAARSRALLPGMPLRARQAMSELMLGDLITHSFYLTVGEAKAPYGDADYVPFVYHEPLPPETLEQVFTPPPGARRITLAHPFLGLKVEVDAGQHAARILRHVDGKRTFGEIFDIVRSERRGFTPGNAPDNAALFADFKPAFDCLNAIERLLLRHKDCPPV